MESDEAIFHETLIQLQASDEAVVWTLGAAKVVNDLKRVLGSKGVLAQPDLYNMAMSGTLKSSSYVRELMLQIKTASLETLSQMVPLILDILMIMPASGIDVSPDDFRDIQDRLNDLIEKSKKDKEVVPVRLNGLTRKSHRVKSTTPKAKKGYQAQTPRQDDATYQLASKLHVLLASYFDKVLRGYQDFFGHEILFYDLKAPHREALMPRPRYAIERALSSPRDYLSCRCCFKATVSYVLSPRGVQLKKDRQDLAKRNLPRQSYISYFLNLEL